MNHFYEFATFRVDTEKRLLWKDGQAIRLKPKAFDTFLFLLENRHKIVTKDEIISAVWDGTAVSDDSLTQQISQLRKVLDDKEHLFIATVPGIGYEFVAEVRQINPPAENDLSAVEISKTEVTNETHQRKSLLAGFSRVSWQTRATVLIVLLVGVSGIFLWRWQAENNPLLEVRKIAVLPFVNFSGEADDLGLGFGMTDTLITKLGNLSNINIQPSAAVMKYNQRERDVGAIAKQLGVDAVLDGNFRQEGNNLRVNVQLIDVRQGKVLWSDSFIENSDEAVFIQDKIAEEIAETLQLELTNDEKRFLAQRYTDNPQAYRFYLKAREIHLTTGADGFMKARLLYTQAVTLDKNFALAYVGLARTYSVFQGVTSPKQAYQVMKGYAQKALEIDNDLSEAHSALGTALWRGEWNWTDAETHFRRAGELTPRFKRANVQYTLLLIGQARFDEAHTVVDRELKETPNDSLILWLKATIWHYSRNYDQAEKAYREILEKYPNHLDSMTGLVLLYIAQNRFDETQHYLEKIKSFSTTATENTYLIPGVIYAKQGQTAKAREMLAELHKLAEKKPGVWGAIALVHTALGEKDKAFEYLEKSIEEREHFGYLLKVNPLYDSLRDDARFGGMLKRVNLAE